MKLNTFNKNMINLLWACCSTLLVFNPNYIALLYETDTGRTMGGISLVSMAAGYLIMAKMVRFEI